MIEGDESRSIFLIVLPLTHWWVRPVERSMMIFRSILNSFHTLNWETFFTFSHASSPWPGDEEQRVGWWFHPSLKTNERRGRLQSLPTSIGDFLLILMDFLNSLIVQLSSQRCSSSPFVPDLENAYFRCRPSLVVPPAISSSWTAIFLFLQWTGEDGGVL